MKANYTTIGTATIRGSISVELLRDNRQMTPEKNRYQWWEGDNDMEMSAATVAEACSMLSDSYSDAEFDFELDENGAVTPHSRYA